jgi:hypothetical protein
LTKPPKQTAKFIKPNQIPEVILRSDSEISENNNKTVDGVHEQLEPMVITEASTLTDWLSSVQV